jgi:selenide,water dikinase
MLTNAAATPGDLLIPKPLGTGLVATAVKCGAATASHERAVVGSMTTLNRQASATPSRSVCAARRTSRASGYSATHRTLRGPVVTLEFTAHAVPSLEGADEALAAGLRTGGAERNESYLAQLVDWGGIAGHRRALLLDPQTSGGLLVACPPALSEDYLSRVPGSVVVGSVAQRGEHLIVLR